MDKNKENAPQLLLSADVPPRLNFIRNQFIQRQTMGLCLQRGQKGC
jgi:hypothetical protein